MKKKLLTGIGTVLGTLLFPSSVLAQTYDQYNSNGLGYGYTSRPVDPSAVGGLFAATWGIIFVIICVTYVLWIALAVWIYKDAKNSKVENPALWAIIVLFFGLIGLLLYFLVGKKSNSTPQPVQSSGPVNTTV